MSKRSDYLGSLANALATSEPPRSLIDQASGVILMLNIEEIESEERWRRIANYAEALIRAGVLAYESTRKSSQ